MNGESAALLLLLLGTFAGALVSSFSRFAFAPVAGVLLFGTFAPKTLVPVLMSCSVFVQVLTLVCMRRSLALGRIGLMVAGGAAGVPLALLLLNRMDPTAFQIAFGLSLTVYASFMLARSRLTIHLAGSGERDVLVGFFGGLVGGLTAMPGAVPTLYCDARGVTKEEQRATVQPFILAMQVFALSLIGGAGELTLDVVKAVAFSIPALALGTALGLSLFGRVPERRFRQVILLLLLTTGCALTARAALHSL